MPRGRRKTARAPSAPAEFVLDCSIVFAWYFQDEADEYADAVATGLVDTRAVVPGHWRLDVANTLIVGERRGRSTEAQAADFLTFLLKLPIAVDELTASTAWTDTLRLARAHQLSAYDAAYLELAMRRGLPLATLDKPLASTAKLLGIANFAPPTA